MNPSHTPALSRGIELATFEAGLIQSKAYRVLRRHLSENLTRHNLTLPEWSLLGQVYKQHGCRLSEISEILNVESSLATNLVNALARKDLVERRPDPTDARAKQVYLTKHGETTVPRIERALRDGYKEFLDDIEPRQLAVYLEVLAKIAAKERS